MMRLFLALATAAVVVAGCGTGSGAADFSDPRADAAAKEFAVAPGKGNIYVYRNQLYMRDIPVEVFLDERWSATTTGQTFFMVEVDPGMHVLRAKGDDVSTLNVFVQPGQNVFVWLQVNPSVSTAYGVLQLKEEGEGKASVRECRRVEALE